MDLSIPTLKADKVAKNRKTESVYIAPSTLEKTMKSLYFTRFMNNKMAKLVRQNKGGVIHLDTRGHELIGILAAQALTPGTDWAFPYYRDRAFAFELGSSLEELFAAFLAKDAPHHSSGRMMPDHFSHKPLRVPVQSSCVGSQFLQAVGCAFSCKLRKTNEVVYVSSGEGGTSQGDFHEALNFSCLHQLPIVFVIQDNGWAISVPSKEQTAGGCISKIASGYPGLLVEVCDGTDYIDAAAALGAAVDKARTCQGPSVIIAKIPRIGAHSSSDNPQKYKTDQEHKQDLLKDPLLRFPSWLLENAYFSKEELESWEHACQKAVDEAAEKAEALPPPKPETVTQFLFKDFMPVSGEKKRGEDVVMMDALNNALIEEMESDPSVVVFGQDVAGGKGGVFGVTKQLTELFGKTRCFNTPLAESTIIGLAIGLSFSLAHKPVAEVQFCDYSWTGINQLFNELSSIYYRSNGVWNCPVTIRMPYGAYIQGGPYHSQRNEAFLAHCPGLKVVIPSNAADAKRLLKTAIRDPNPVIFLEHKTLYRQRVFAARKEPSSEELLPFGKAKVVAEGSDLTVVTYGAMVMMAFDVVQKLANEGIQVELIDLRTLVPLDEALISSSVRKTGKLLILQEASLFAGFGAEIAARVTEKDFHYLDAPIQRLGALHIPVPYAKGLEDAMLPQKPTIEKALRDLYAY